MSADVLEDLSSEAQATSTEAESLIVENLDLWASTIKTKNSVGRGSSKKIDLYGIKKLRELILELAVRGKLVPQDPSDEPASVLLEKIAAEKERLVQSGKLKKQKSLPEVDSYNSFDLPNGWALARMPEVISVDKYAIKRGPFGSALKKAFFVSEGYKVYEQQHAINDDFFRGEYYITEEKFSELSAFEVNPNDLIVSCSGTVGRVAVAPKNMEPGIINQALLKITLNESALTNEYFKILFPAFFMKTETLSDLQGTAQKNMVSVDTLKNEPFPYPPLAEQHRIVTKVNELMALCDQLESQSEQSLDAHATLANTLLDALTNAQNAEELADNWQRLEQNWDILFPPTIAGERAIEKLKQTILQLAVMGKLVPQNPNDEPASVLLGKIAEEKARLIKEKKIKKQKPLPPISDEEKPFELPVGWEWVRFGTVTFSRLGKMLDKAKNRGEFRPYLRNTNVQWHRFVLDDVKEMRIEKEEVEEYRVLPGDLLICEGGEPGRCAIWNDEDKEIYYQKALHRARSYTGINQEYLQICLTVDAKSKVLDRYFTGATIKHFPGDKLNRYVHSLPPSNEQHRIVTKVNELMSLCDTLKERIQTAQTTQLKLTDAITQQALKK